MAFDPRSARPLASGFDPSTARPADDELGFFRRRMNVLRDDLRGAEESIGRPAASAGAAVVRGAVGDIVPSAVQGVIIAEQAGLQELVKGMDAIDAGQPLHISNVRKVRGQPLPTPNEALLLRYSDAAPEMRAQLRQQIEAKVEDPRTEPFYAHAQEFREGVERAFPEDPQHEGSFWLSKVPRGIGSTFGFAGAGKALTLGRGGPVAAGAAASLTGGEVSATQGFQEALQEGATIEQAFRVSELNRLAGYTEGLPIAAFFDKLDRATAGAVRRAIVDTLLQAGEEGVQELTQKLMANLAAQKVYDPDRNIWTGTDEATGVGVTVGGLMGFVSSLVAGRRAPMPRPGVQPGQPLPETPQAPQGDDIDLSEAVPGGAAAASAPPEAAAEAAPAPLEGGAQDAPAPARFDPSTAKLLLDEIQPEPPPATVGELLEEAESKVAATKPVTQEDVQTTLDIAEGRRDKSGKRIVVKEGALESMADERLDDRKYRGVLEGMAEEAGWAEVGGKLKREGGEEGRFKAHTEGEVTGRTSWAPHAPWFADVQRSAGLTGNNEGKATREAVRKAIAGEPLTAAERRHVTALLEHADGTLKTPEDDPYAPENVRFIEEALKATEPQEGGKPVQVEATEDDILNNDLLARAAEVDPDGFERAAVQFENDDPGLIRWAEGVVYGGRKEVPQQVAEADPGGSEARGAPAQDEAAGEPGEPGEAEGEVRSELSGAPPAADSITDADTARSWADELERRAADAAPGERQNLQRKALDFDKRARALNGAGAIALESTASTKPKAEEPAPTRKIKRAVEDAREAGKTDTSPAAYAKKAQELADNPRHFSADIAKELFPEYGVSIESRRKESDRLQDQAGKVRDEAFADALAQPVTEETSVVTFMAGGTGSGKTSLAQKTGIVYDSTLANYDNARAKIDAALASGRDVDVRYIFRDPVEAYREGVKKRAERIGRDVPKQIHANTHRGSYESVGKLAEHYAGDKRVQFRYYDNSGLTLKRLTELPQMDYNGLDERLDRPEEAAATRAEPRAGLDRQADVEGPAGARGSVPEDPEGPGPLPAPVLKETPPEGGVSASGPAKATTPAPATPATQTDLFGTAVQALRTAADTIEKAAKPAEAPAPAETVVETAIETPDRTEIRTKEPEAQSPGPATDGILADVESDIPLSVAVAAYNHTSHNPERRGASDARQYAETVRADYAGLRELAKTPEQQAQLDETFGKYRAGYKDRYLAYLHSHANVASAFIVGPANFPTARNEKRANWAQNKLNEALGFRKRMLERMRADLRPETERAISSDDADAATKLQNKVAALERLQDKMKAANAALRKGDDDAMRALGFDDTKIAKLKTPDFAGRVGFPDYVLSNNSAEIRRLKGRAAQVQVQRSEPERAVTFAGGRASDNATENRLQVFFDAKPPAETREKLKAHGFRWAPSVGAWQRMRGPQAWSALQTVVGPLQEATPPARVEEPSGSYNLDRDGNYPRVEAPQGEAIPESAPGETAPAGSERSGVRRNAQPAAKLRAEVDLPGRYATRTQLVRVATRKIGATRVTNLAQAATALSYLDRGAQERFDVLLTSERGVPLAVVGAFKGTIDGAAVYPREVVTEAFAVQGASHAYFAHNHPSGLSTPSSADRMLTERLNMLFEGSGIKLMGHIVVGNGTYSSMAADGSALEYGLTVPPSVGSRTVPVVEREFVERGRLRGPVRGPSDARAMLADLPPDESGIVLLDNQHTPTAFVQLKPEQTMPLRETGGMDRIIRAVGLGNAAAAMIVDSQARYTKEQVENVGGLLKTMDVRMLDVLRSDKAGDPVVSWAERGWEAGQSGRFQSRATAEDEYRGLPVSYVEHVADAITQNLPGAPRILVYERPDQLAETLRAGTDERTEGVFVGGILYLFAGNIASKERAAWVALHELHHAGLAGAYGAQLDAALNELEENDFIKRLADAITTDRADEDLSRTDALNEAVAELGAAIGTGDFAHIKERYGLQVPGLYRPGIRGVIDRFVEAIRKLLNGLMGRETFATDEVRAMLGRVRGALAGERPTFQAPVGETAYASQQGLPEGVTITTLQEGAPDGLRHQVNRDDYPVATFRRREDAAAVGRAIGSRPYTAGDVTGERLRQAASRGAGQNLGGLRGDGTRGSGEIIRSVDRARALRQRHDKKGFCYALSAAEAHDGYADYIIGTIAETMPGSPRIFHAIAKLKDGLVYDGTYGKHFAPGIYEQAYAFEPIARFTPEQIRHFTDTTGLAFPDPQNLGLVGFLDADALRTRAAAARAERAARLAAKALPGREGGVGPGARSQSAPIFYSGLSRAIAANMADAEPAGTLALKIAGWQSGGKFKAEELEWSGLREWLADQQGRVTRDQVLDFLRANEIRVEEVVRGAAGRGAQQAEAQELAGALEARGYILDWDEDQDGTVRIRSVEKRDEADQSDVWTSEHDFADEDSPPLPQQDRRRIERLRDLTDEIGSVEELESTYETYTLPGAKEGSYRELLLTLPVERGFDPEDPQRPRPFMSSHFDVPNVLAHVRFNERTDADGKRVLFIEEIQSDWHQRGRREGYNKAGAEFKEDLVEELGRALVAEDNLGFDRTPQALRAIAMHEDFAERWELAPETVALANRYRAAPHRHGVVPNAPFKTTWPMLAMKRMLRYAVDNGYDRIAWTTGEQQADRYDLSKHVAEVHVTRNERQAALGHYIVDIVPRGRDRGSSGRHTIEAKEDLPNIVGKEMADKIVSDLPEAGQKHYTGLDLKVGGEGMVAFYDKMLPSELNRYTKKWGGKVGTTKIEKESNEYLRGLAERAGQEREVRPSDFHEVHAIDITDAMRESVRAGQPLFSKRPPPAPPARRALQSKAPSNEGVRVSRGANGFLDVDDASPDAERAARARLGAALDRAIKDSPRLKAALDAAANRTRVPMLATMTRRMLEESYAHLFDNGALTAYSDAKAASDAEANKLAAQTDETARRWMALSAKEKGDLASLMHEATLAGVRPNGALLDTTSLERQLKLVTIKRKGIESGVEHHPQGGTERQHLAVARLFSQERRLEAQISNAEKNHAALVKRYQAMSERARGVYDEAEKGLQERYEQERQAALARVDRLSVWDPAEGRAVPAPAEVIRDLKARLNRAYEEAAGVEPYFPLKRFGDFVVRVQPHKDFPEGLEPVEFFESSYDAEIRREQLRKQGYESVLTKRESFFDPKMHSAAPGFIRDAMEAIDQSKLEDADKKNMQDLIRQLWLKSLPDASALKTRIHRTGVPGYNEDALRSFAFTMLHQGNRIARLGHTDKMEQAIEQMEQWARDHEGVDGSEKNTARRDVITEVRRHYHDALNPKYDSLAHGLQQAGFLFYLGANISTAILNTTQILQFTVPGLVAEFGTFKTVEALKNTLADVANPTRLSLNLHDRKVEVDSPANLTADELKAYEQWANDGVISITQAHDLATLAERGSDALPGTGVRDKVLRWGSLPQHTTERFNREFTALAHYRLSRTRGWTHDASVKAAARFTYRTQFDYSSGNRARLMRHPWLKVITLFKNYSVHVIYRQWRDLRTALGFNEVGAEERRIATREFIGRTVMVGMMTGTMGLMGVTTILGFLSFLKDLFDDDDLPTDLEYEISQWLEQALEAFGIGEKLAYGLVPRSLSERANMANLLYREDDRDIADPQDWLEKLFVGTVGGPVAGMFVNTAKGARTVADGDYWRGVNMMLPLALASPSKAAMYAREGMLDRQGNPVLEDLTPSEIAGQAIGFRPSRSVSRWEDVSYQRNAEQALQRAKSNIVGHIVRAIQAEDEEAEERWWAEADRWSARHPDYPVKAGDVQGAYKRALRRGMKQAEGQYTSDAVARELERQETE